MTASRLDYRVLSRLDSRAREVESELLAIHAAAPETIDLPGMFTAAVTDAMSNILDESTAKALEVYIGKTNLGDPKAVFSSLDALLDQGAHIVKGAIIEEFRSKVHWLYEDVVLQSKDALAVGITSFSKGDAVSDSESASSDESPAEAQAEEKDVVVRFVRSAKSQRS